MQDPGVFRQSAQMGFTLEIVHTFGGMDDGRPGSRIRLLANP